MMDPPESEEVDILALSQDFLFSILREEFSLSSLSVMLFLSLYACVLSQFSVVCPCSFNPALVAIQLMVSEL